MLGVGPNQIKKFLEVIGEKAPAVEYTAPAAGDFDGESLTEEARKSTVLVIAIRGAPQDTVAAAPAAADAEGEKKGDETP